MAAVEFALAGIGRDESMRRSFAFLTSENFFALMGVKPALGRFYSAEESRPNANQPVVVASYAFWKRMGGHNDFLGSTLSINGQPYTVIGVTPKGFSGISALLAPYICSTGCAFTAWLRLFRFRRHARLTSQRTTPSISPRACAPA